MKKEIKIITIVQKILDVDRKAIKYENHENGLILKMQYGPYIEEAILQILNLFPFSEYFPRESEFLFPTLPDDQEISSIETQVEKIKKPYNEWVKIHNTKINELKS